MSVTGGELRGRRMGESEAFLGIPYAAPPTGPRRWAAPEPAASWTGERNAGAPGPVCPQPARPFSEWAHGPLPATDEDSLTLNVWRPVRADGRPRPVLVFVHGGGWALGWGSNPLLDARHLAPALDAVVVTCNYRLGSLGWLAHPGLGDGGADRPAGNWGLLDQLAVLRWVQTDIAAFGGDPARVTLGGESAGAGNVLHMLSTSGAAGLFTRAIALSPPLHELVVSESTAERWAAALTAELGAGEDVTRALGTLRELPAQAIVDAHERLIAGPFRGTRGGALPVVDPATLDADPATVPGASPHVPLLIGSSADEGTFFFRAGGRRLDPEPPELAQIVARVTHDPEPERLITDATERLARRGLTDPVANDVLCAVVTEAWFAGPIERYVAGRVASPGRPSVHRYRIEHRSPDPAGLGALHSMSVPLLFGSWREGGVARRLTGDGAEAAATTAALQADVRRFVHGQALGWAPADAGGEAVYGAV